MNTLSLDFLKRTTPPHHKRGPQFVACVSPGNRYEILEWDIERQQWVDNHGHETYEEWIVSVANIPPETDFVGVKERRS